jgi:uncharacterized protein (DUF305 family)
MTTSWLRRRGLLTLELVSLLVIAFVVGRLSIGGSGSSPKPGAVDVGFSQDMAVHHEQAVELAALSPGRAGDAVQAIANTILTGQSQEIGLMRGWLQLWGKPSVDQAPMAWMPASALGTTSMDGMAMGGVHTGDAALAAGSTAMPGMATSAELSRLTGLRGTAFDVLFLQLMIRHHEGGIEMAQYAQANARLAVVRDAARAMAFAQVEDLAQMRPLLAADGASPLPPP